MAFKMNGSPAKMGTIKGTAGHASALKARKEEVASALKAMYSTEYMEKNPDKKEEMKKNMEATKRVNKKMPDADWKKGQKKAKSAGNDLDALVKKRGGLKKGTPEYAKVQNKINAALGSKKRHDEGTTSKTNVKHVDRNEKIVSKGDVKLEKIEKRSEKKKGEVKENVDRKLAKSDRRAARKTSGRGSKEHLEAKKKHLEAKEADRQGKRGGKKQSFFRKLSSKINKRRQDKIDKKIAEKESSPATMYGHSKKKK